MKSNRVKRFYNGPADSQRSCAMIEHLIEDGYDGPLYIITSVDRRKTHYWETVLGALKWEGEFTVDSWFRSEQYTDVTGAFFIFDGDQVYRKAKWTKHFLKITKQNDWFVAANYHDAWVSYMPLFVACGFYKNNAEFQREHIVLEEHCYFPKIKSYKNVYKLVDRLERIRLTQPYRRGRSDE